MFTPRGHSSAKKSAEGEGKRADASVGPKGPQRLNPVWQSLAMGRSLIQFKLTVSQPDDPYEREADHVAGQAMRMPAPQSDGCGLSITAGTAHQAQRKCAECEEEEEGTLQRKDIGSTAEAPSTIPPIVEQTLSSPGKPLDAATRAYFEPQFGHDFSGVRVHTDANAAESARVVNALAYTVSNDIVLGAGQYRPGTTVGNSLLAHELTHVIQQGSGQRSVQRKPVSEIPGPEVQFVASTLGFNPLDIATMAQAPDAAIATLKRLRDVPFVGEFLFSVLPISDGIEKLLSLDSEVLDQIFAILQDPEQHLEQVRTSLQPIVDELPAYAMAEAEARLGWLKEQGEPFARVLEAMGLQLEQIPGQWWPMLKEIIRSQFMLWDWETEKQDLKELAKQHEEGKFDDEYEYWIQVTKVLADGLDRILGAIGMAAFIFGLAGGGTLGAAAGGTGAGVVGGAVTVGAGAAPSAAVGGTAGAGAGGGVGGGIGATVYELLGGVSIGLSIGTEVLLLADAAEDLAFEEQNPERENEDYKQIAASIIALAMMAAFALLGSFGVRLARKIKQAILTAVGKLSAGLEAARKALPGIELPAASTSNPFEPPGTRSPTPATKPTEPPPTTKRVDPTPVDEPTPSINTIPEGVPESVIKANKGFIDGKWMFEQVINNGKIRYDLLPAEMAEYLRQQRQHIGGMLSPAQMEFNMTAEFGPKRPPPEQQIPRRRGGPPDPDADLKPPDPDADLKPPDPDEDLKPPDTEEDLKPPDTDEDLKPE